MHNKHLFTFLLGVFLLRLVVSDAIPLMDTSEARYAEMARKMVETGNWVTPMFTDTEPFWGKPPLSFWSQALAISVFGESEWVSRLPSFLLHLLNCGLIFVLVNRMSSTRQGLIACVIYSSTALGFMASGVVLTDPALNTAILMSFFGFWYFMQGYGKSMAYLGFVGIGLGLLAKGPIAVVLFALPIAFWMALNNQWSLFRSIPWLAGLLIVAVIAVPWYWMAETATPGFIDYFIVGEHFNRYLVSDWAGDRYGDAHSRPLGTIWIFLLLALFPWVIYLLRPYTWRAISQVDDRAWKSYLWCWALLTPIFFTLAGNILWTYLLPCLAPWIILLSYRFAEDKRTRWDFVLASAFVPVVMFAISFNGNLIEKSINQKAVISYWQELYKSEDIPLFYFYKRLYSGEYYSQGHAMHITAVNDLPSDKRFYLAIRMTDFSRHGIPKGVTCERQENPKVINETALMKCERTL